MTTVTVNRDDLLKALKENRDKHRDVFMRAIKGYRERVIAELDRSLQDAKSGRKICRYVGLVEPEDHTKDYDRIIRMTEMEVSDTMELSESEFSSYVMDEWSWRQSFTTSTANYTA